MSGVEGFRHRLRIADRSEAGAAPLALPRKNFPQEEDQGDARVCGHLHMVFGPEAGAA